MVIGQAQDGIPSELDRTLLSEVLKRALLAFSLTYETAIKGYSREDAVMDGMVALLEDITATASKSQRKDGEDDLEFVLRVAERSFRNNQRRGKSKVVKHHPPGMNDSATTPQSVLLSETRATELRALQFLKAQKERTFAPIQARVREALASGKADSAEMVARVTGLSEEQANEAIRRIRSQSNGSEHTTQPFLNRETPEQGTGNDGEQP